MTLIKVSDLSKAFRTYHSEWFRFASWFGLSIKPKTENWVLRHINIEIFAGQSIGIIGQNGAGKSTLLKLITGTMQPTEGNIYVYGRIAAILELGMGFNPELTGRQNVYHAAGLMGFNDAQINQVMPDIESFAEIGNYFDEPVRTYSSGMQVRVAFAVATAYRPEILIVDEALSVGDAYFQHKSFNRMREFQEKGTTFIIVSHDRSAIQSLCDYAYLLEGGNIIREGFPEEVFDYYNAIIAEKNTPSIEVHTLENGKSQTCSGTGEAKVKSIGLYNANNDKAEFVGIGEIAELRISVEIIKDIDTLVFGYGIKDRIGQVMYGTNTWHTGQVIHGAKAGDIYDFTVSFPVTLGVGSYSIQTALTDSDTHLNNNYEWKDLALLFNVVNNDKKQFIGCIWNEPEIKIGRYPK